MVLEGVLIVAAFCALIILFSPKRGLYHRWRKHARSGKRDLLEDALKHIYNCEYGDIPCTLESLAGATGFNRNRAWQLIDQLNANRLITVSGSNLKLTEEGRHYAVKVIRVHRLWERHLADETMVNELNWHKEAEKIEHKLTPEDVNVLSKRLGHPVYDPHGDPIPTAAGALPGQQGSLLQSFVSGDVVTITHIEDEPDQVYEQIVKEGIYPGMSLRIIEHGVNAIVVEKEGKQLELPVIVATNLRGLKARRDQYIAEHKTLGDLKTGERGTIVGISPACRGMQRRRLMDLGIVPGTVVEAEMASAFGDPIAYRVRGSSVALRKQQAEMIYIRESGSA
jgi:DtxR family Mn-dependent transcriptional regulator